MNLPWTYNFPIWVTWVGVFLTLVLALEIGDQLGQRRLKRIAKPDRGSGGEIAMTALYGLLGLVLAFTYAYTMSRVDHRRQAIIAEANAIGTAFLRSGFMAEPEGSQLRATLRDYGESRIVPHELIRRPDKLQQWIAESLAIQAELWPLLESRFSKGDVGLIELSVMQSINQVIDIHTVRLAASFDTLPLAVLVMLWFIAVATLAISGYNRGVSGGMPQARMIILALVLTVVITTITDVDRVRDGMIRLNLLPLEEAVRNMNLVLASEEGGPGIPSD